MVYKRIAAGATYLRDLAYTAWIESSKPVPQVKLIDQPHNPKIRASTRPPVRRLPQLISNGRATQSLPVTQRADACCRGLQK